ncbi:Uncharacterized protein FKW44_011519 [Caligus rogercresseyi]|uniref:C2H2-type domain-containing protein n=1 Tax=Caligus rogercresseyi TaxID=217165 RepID=A0A7T8K870_CALRO|nr:Uncharacterized protein FKW44_011519 [Caligus rogercresseyi]
MGKQDVLYLDAKTCKDATLSSMMIIAQEENGEDRFDCSECLKGYKHHPSLFRHFKNAHREKYDQIVELRRRIREQQRLAKSLGLPYYRRKNQKRSHGFSKKNKENAAPKRSKEKKITENITPECEQPPLPSNDSTSLDLNENQFIENGMSHQMNVQAVPSSEAPVSSMSSEINTPAPPTSLSFVPYASIPSTTNASSNTTPSSTFVPPHTDTTIPFHPTRTFIPSTNSTSISVPSNTAVQVQPSTFITPNFDAIIPIQCNTTTSIPSSRDISTSPNTIIPGSHLTPVSKDSDFSLESLMNSEFNELLVPSKESSLLSNSVNDEFGSLMEDSPSLQETCPSNSLKVPINEATLPFDQSVCSQESKQEEESKGTKSENPSDSQMSQCVLKLEPYKQMTLDDLVDDTIDPDLFGLKSSYDQGLNNQSNKVNIESGSYKTVEAKTSLNDTLTELDDLLNFHMDSHLQKESKATNNSGLRSLQDTPPSFLNEIGDLFKEEPKILSNPAPSDNMDLGFFPSDALSVTSLDHLFGPPNSNNESKPNNQTPEPQVKKEVIKPETPSSNHPIQASNPSVSTHSPKAIIKIEPKKESPKDIKAKTIQAPSKSTPTQIKTMRTQVLPKPAPLKIIHTQVPQKPAPMKIIHTQASQKPAHFKIIQARAPQKPAPVPIKIIQTQASSKLTPRPPKTNPAPLPRPITHKSLKVISAVGSKVATNPKILTFDSKRVHLVPIRSGVSVNTKENNSQNPQVIRIASQGGASNVLKENVLKRTITMQSLEPSQIPTKIIRKVIPIRPTKPASEGPIILYECSVCYSQFGNKTDFDTHRRTCGRTVQTNMKTNTPPNSIISLNKTPAISNSNAVPIQAYPVQEPITFSCQTCGQPLKDLNDISTHPCYM